MIGERLSRHWFDHYGRVPFWRAVPFFLLLALLAIDVTFGIWGAVAYWDLLSPRSRFLLVFLIATAPLVLFGTVQQQRFLRTAEVQPETARRVLVLTFIVGTWAYALIGIALRVLFAVLGG